MGLTEGDSVGLEVEVVGCKKYVLARCKIIEQSSAASIEMILILTFLTSSLGEEVGLTNGDLVGLKVASCNEGNVVSERSKSDQRLISINRQ